MQSGFNPYVMGASALLGTFNKFFKDRQQLNTQMDFLNNQDFSVGVDNMGRPMFSSISDNLANISGIDRGSIGKGMGLINQGKAKKVRKQYDAALNRAEGAITNFNTQNANYFANENAMTDWTDQVSSNKRLRNLYNIPTI